MQKMPEEKEVQLCTSYRSVMFFLVEITFDFLCAYTVDEGVRINFSDLGYHRMF